MHKKDRRMHEHATVGTMAHARMHKPIGTTELTCLVEPSSSGSVNFKIGRSKLFVIWVMLRVSGRRIRSTMSLVSRKWIMQSNMRWTQINWTIQWRHYCWNCPSLPQNRLFKSTKGAALWRILVRKLLECKELEYATPSCWIVWNCKKWKFHLCLDHQWKTMSWSKGRFSL